MFFKKNLIFLFNFNNVENWVEKDESFDVIKIDVKTSNRWENIARIYDKYKYRMFFYKTISFVDCDIKISNDKLIEYFEIFKKYNLNIASPAYKGSNFFSKKKCFLRNVNCLPRKFLTFNFNSIKKSRQYLQINQSGSGVEWVLPKVLNYEKISIIDRIVVDNYYKEKKKKVVIKDLVHIYNNFDLQNLYNIEFSRIKHDEEKCWCYYIDVSMINKHKFRRPSRRSNDCCNSQFYLSSRIMNSTMENMK